MLVKSNVYWICLSNRIAGEVKSTPLLLKEISLVGTSTSTLMNSPVPSGWDHVRRARSLRQPLALGEWTWCAHLATQPADARARSQTLGGKQGRTTIAWPILLNWKNHITYATMWPPPVTSWFISPSNDSYKYHTPYSYWSLDHGIIFLICESV